MPERETLRVTGYRDLLRAVARSDASTKRRVRSAFRQVGEDVRQDATARFSSIDEHSAAGYRVRVRQRGVAVEQSLRKTTGTRPDYGALQMRKALLPALATKASDVDRRMQKALDEIADDFDRN
jgi:hypothetical protein